MPNIHKTVKWKVFEEDSNTDYYEERVSFIVIDRYKLSTMFVITRSVDYQDVLRRVFEEKVSHSGDYIKFYYCDGEYVAVSLYEGIEIIY